MTKTPKEILGRYYDRINFRDDHWIWTGPTDKYSPRDGNVRLRQFVYKRARGSAPRRISITCIDTCLNPEHMVGTARAAEATSHEGYNILMPHDKREAMRLREIGWTDAQIASMMACDVEYLQNILDRELMNT